MSGMKYVMYDDDTFTIFPQNIEHSTMRPMGKIPVSAGFLKFKDLDKKIPSVSCFDRSFSLDLESRPKVDSFIINNSLRMAILK